MFALMWSVGALIELEDRAKMEQFLVDKVCRPNMFTRKTTVHVHVATVYV